MTDLIAQLKAKAGLTDDQAVKAIQVMKEYIHQQVPPMFSGVVEKFFAKNGPSVAPEDDPLA